MIPDQTTKIATVAQQLESHPSYALQETVADEKYGGMLSVTKW